MKKHYCDFCGTEVPLSSNASTRVRDGTTYPEQRIYKITATVEISDVAAGATCDKCMADYLESLVHFLRGEFENPTPLSKKPEKKS